MADGYLFITATIPPWQAESWEPYIHFGCVSPIVISNFWGAASLAVVEEMKPE